MKTEDSAECHQITLAVGQSGNETIRRKAWQKSVVCIITILPHCIVFTTEM